MVENTIEFLHCKKMMKGSFGKRPRLTKLVELMPFICKLVPYLLTRASSNPNTCHNADSSLIVDCILQVEAKFIDLILNRFRNHLPVDPRL